MYRKINNLVITDQSFKVIAGLHRETQVHKLLHVSGASEEMKRAMGDMVYHEVGKGEHDVTVKTPIDNNSNLLLIHPSNEFLTNKDFLKQLDSVPIGSYVIAVLQDTNLHNRPMPYDDSTLPFFGKLRQNFVLMKTKQMMLQRSRSYRYDNEITHIFTAYVLKRLDVKKENNVDRGKYLINDGLETEYIPPVQDGYPPIDSPLNYQHPVKSIRRMPVLLRPLGNALDREHDRKMLEHGHKIKDKAFDIDPKRNDNKGTTVFKSEVGLNKDSGFVLGDKDPQNFGEEHIKTYES